MTAFILCAITFIWAQCQGSFTLWRLLQSCNFHQVWVTLRSTEGVHCDNSLSTTWTPSLDPRLTHSWKAIWIISLSLEIVIPVWTRCNPFLNTKSNSHIGVAVSKNLKISIGECKGTGPLWAKIFSISRCQILGENLQNSVLDSPLERSMLPTVESLDPRPLQSNLLDWIWKGNEQTRVKEIQRITCSPVGQSVEIWFQVELYADTSSL